MTNMLNCSHVQNDQCSNATDFGAFTDGQNIILTGQSNLGASDDMSEAPRCVRLPYAGVWYKLNVADTAWIEVSTCNQADFDTVIAVYGGACRSLVCADGADNADGCGYTSHAVVYVESPVIYILVNGYQGDIGNFNLTVSVTTIPPPVSSGGKD